MVSQSQSNRAMASQIPITAEVPSMRPTALPNTIASQTMPENRSILMAMVTVNAYPVCSRLSIRLRRLIEGSRRPRRPAAFDC